MSFEIIDIRYEEGKVKYFIHFWLILITEIKRTKASKAFHLVALASPLMFLYAFAGNLAQDISFPVALKNESLATHYTDFVPYYKSPSGTPYFSITEKTGKDVPAIIIKEDLPKKEGKIAKPKVSESKKEVIKNE